MDRKEEFGSRSLANLDHWISEEEDIQNQEDDEQSEEGEDENNDYVAVIDGDTDKEVEILVEEKDDNASSISEDLSLLTVVQLKDRLRNLGLRVSGRKQELIDRLNHHIQSK